MELYLCHTHISINQSRITTFSKEPLLCFRLLEGKYSLEYLLLPMFYLNV